MDMHPSTHGNTRHTFFAWCFFLLAIMTGNPNLLAAEGLEKKWKNDLQEWKHWRIENLKKPFGWLSLVGMEWLHEGANTIGRSQDNRIRLSHGADRIGQFDYDGDRIFFTPAPGVTVFANGKRITETIPAATDRQENTTKFTHDSFQFYVIERGKPAVRIKDSQAPTRTGFAGLEYFPADPKWRVKAKYTPYHPAKTIEIINVLGQLNEEASPGFVEFALDGTTYRLDVIDEGSDEYFIIFADRTNGRSTYGPGRFLYIKKPDENNETWVDFNRAYNPPCAFTDYSTCPLPPPQNRLRVFVTAGEKKYTHQKD